MSFILCHTGTQLTGLFGGGWGEVSPQGVATFGRKFPSPTGQALTIKLPTSAHFILCFTFKGAQLYMKYSRDSDPNKTSGPIRKAGQFMYSGLDFQGLFTFLFHLRQLHVHVHV